MLSRTRSSFLRGATWIPVLLGAVSLAQGCANRADDCDANSTCPPSGGTPSGGTGGSPSAGKSGASTGGTSGAGQAGATAGGGNGPGGEGGTAGEGGGPPEPCNGACVAPTPACNEATNTCVECLAPTDCKTDDKTLCDTTSNTCVECLAPTDCKTPTASRCDAGECTACTTNSDCAHIAGKTVCDADAGECVQCTGTDYASCGMDAGTPLVCDSLARTCTTTKEASAGLCQPCLTDAQCKAGQLCVMETFGSENAEVGYFCFWQKGAPVGGAPALCSSARPYVETIAEQISVDGQAGDICGLAVSTCLARNEFRAKDCTTNNVPDDSKCGFEPGQDSKCEQFDAGVYRCTMACGSVDDCPSGFDCDTGANPPVCEL